MSTFIDWYINTCKINEFVVIWHYKINDFGVLWHLSAKSMTNSLNGKKLRWQNRFAQILKANGNSLFYYTFLDEKSRHNFEIDFLLAWNNKVCPIEIKSSGYKTHASLDAFSEKYSSRILNKYLVYTKDLGKDKDVFSVPVYMTMFL